MPKLSLTERRAALEAQLAEITATEAQEAQPLIDEAQILLSEAKVTIERITALARSLPEAPHYSSARMMASSLEQVFGGTVIAFDGAGQ